MACDYPTAINEMFAVANTALGVASAASTLCGYDIDLRWQGVEKSTKPDASKCWARVSQSGVTAPQSALSDQVSGPSLRRYTPTGLLTVQVFAPMVTTGMDTGRKLAQIARNAYRGTQTASGVIFRNVRIIELANDGKSYRFNVVAE